MHFSWRIFSNCNRAFKLFKKRATSRAKQAFEGEKIDDDITEISENLQQDYSIFLVGLFFCF